MNAPAIREQEELQGRGELTLREAEGEDGLVWEAILIKAGLSGNRNFYPDAVLREAVPLFDGRPVFAKADAEHLRSEGRDVNRLVGWISEPRFVEGPSADTGQVSGRVNLLRSARTLREAIADAWRRGKRDLVGLSIDALGRTIWPTCAMGSCVSSRPLRRSPRSISSSSRPPAGAFSN